MFKISCFADEIAPDLDTQIRVMKECNVKYVELRSVWDKNILKLDDGEISTIKTNLAKNGISVSSIGSPIGKVDLEFSLENHLTAFKRAVTVAKEMGTQYIRVFSFYLGERDAAQCKDEVIRRLKAILKIAKDNNIIVLHENEAGIYGQSSCHCRDLFTGVNDTDFRGVFDPSNFVVAGEDPYYESLPRVDEYIEYIHVKDSIKGTHEIVEAGAGDGQMRRIIDHFRKKDGMFLSLEPHLMEAGINKGFSGEELFKKDHKALTDLLREIEVDFE